VKAAPTPKFFEVFQVRLQLNEVMNLETLMTLTWIFSAYSPL